MKKIILSLAVVSMTFAYAQKKEVSAAFKAAQSNDVATATSQLAAADAALGGKTYLLEPEVQEQYYFTKGVTLLKSGKTLEAAQYLAKVADMGKQKVYAGKDGKTKVYFVGKAQADASGISGLKEESYQPTLVPKIAEMVNPMVQAANKAAVDAYDAKQYAVAGPKFREVYNLLKAAGQENKQYLYFSGITYAMAEDKPNAIAVYKELIDSGYNGVQTRYFATEKKSGQEQEFDKSSWDLLKKTEATGEYSGFRNETTPNIEQELYETYAGLLLDAEKYDELIAHTKAAKVKFPKSARLTELEGVAYYRAGKTDDFMASLKELVAKNPQDKISYYNLGVIASKDPSKLQEAEGYFKKAVEIDPNYAPAYQNLTYMIMDVDNDQKHIDKYNELRKAQKSAEANKIMEDRRARFARALPFAEKWYQADPNNLDAVTLLKGLYQSTRNEAKFQEFKAKEAAMKNKK